MRPRVKKLIGVLLFLPLLGLYALGTAALSAYLHVAQWPLLLQFGFFVLMGIVWIFPAKPCLMWMQKEPVAR